MNMKKIAVAIALLGVASQSNAMEAFNPRNGMHGMGGYVFIKLLKLPTIKGSPATIKAILGMNKSHYSLKDSVYFLEVVGSYYDAMDHNDLMKNGDFFKAKMKLNYLLTVAKNINDQDFESDVKALIVKHKKAVSHMSFEWLSITSDYACLKPIGISFHFDPFSRNGEVSRLDNAMVERYGKTTQRMVDEGRLAEVDNVLVKLHAANKGNRTTEEEIERIRSDLRKLTEKGCNLVK